jgi:hypothetical protein
MTTQKAPGVRRSDYCELVSHPEQLPAVLAAREKQKPLEERRD